MQYFLRSIVGSVLANKIILICLLALSISFEVQAADYYWVQGSGNWSDINHWATSSGGSIIHAQVPTSFDNVIFDENSFITDNNIVIINAGNPVCRTMDWSNALRNPVLEGADTINLRIFGSLMLTSNMAFNFMGSINFEATSGSHNLDIAGQSLRNTVTFNGIGGQWNLQNDLFVEGNIFMNYGILGTNDYSINCTGFISIDPNIREIHLGNSEIHADQWQLNGQNLLLHARESQIYLTGNMANFDGDKIIFNNIWFSGFSGSLSNQNNYTRFNNLVFYNDGIIFGECSIDTLTITGNGSISGQDSIIYATAGGNCNLNESQHVIKQLIIGNRGNITGTNKAEEVLILGKGIIEGDNIIHYAMIKDTSLVSGTNFIDHIILERKTIIEGHNIFEFALLKRRGNFYGENTFDTLNLSPDGLYYFEANATQIINNEFGITGTCSKPIFLKSNQNGERATIQKNQNTVIAEYISLRDIEAGGLVPFQANNSVDLGNNPNWNINVSSGRDLYWVGGSGDWDNPQHWDIASGGPGGHCPPTEIDNAFFDGNSFTSNNNSVTLNIENAVCKDMDWTGAGNAPVFYGSDTNYLRIYGSLTLITNMSLNMLGKVFFEATTGGHSITSAGQTFLNKVYFIGRNGGWNFKDDFTSISNVYQYEGNIDTEGNTIDVRGFISESTQPRGLLLHNSNIKLFSPDSAWYIDAENMFIKADSSFIQSYGPGAEVVTLNDRVVYWNCEFYGPFSSLVNEQAQCQYNLITFFDASSAILGECRIDTATFHGPNGSIYQSDTIKTAIFYELDGLIDGDHWIEIAYFHRDGEVTGASFIDTTFFFQEGIITGNNTIDTALISRHGLIEGRNLINRAHLKGDAEMNGQNTFNWLKLNQGKTYTYEHDSTQTITDRFDIDGTCNWPIIFRSDENGKQAILHKSNGDVAAHYLTLRDIKAEGAVLPFIAYNGVDLGNNTDWDIRTSQSRNLYWVNGNGNWADSDHWSLSSGGPGGECIPTALDNVFFDQASFVQAGDSAIIDIGNALCHNMDWTLVADNPVFFCPDTNNLNIYGSLHLSSDMNFNIFGIIYFEAASAGKNILSASQAFKNEIHFQGIGGSWSLLDSLQSNHIIYFKNGTLNTVGNVVECVAFNSDFNTPRNLNISNSTFIVTGIGLEAWYVNATNLQLNAENSTIISLSTDGHVRTDYGHNLTYHNIEFKGARSWLNSYQGYAGYNLVQFEHNGQIHGDCFIDSVLIYGNGSIHNSDSIHFINIYGNGNLTGGQHVVDTIYIGLDGNISGSNEVELAVFYSTGTIDGDNKMDSVYFSSDGNIVGNNSIEKSVVIWGNATVEGTNHINSISLMGDGLLTGPNIFGNVRLTPGRTYELEYDETQTINGVFRIRGNNCFQITLRSTRNGYEAFISKSDGIVSGDFIEMRDIHAGGGATFYAGGFSTDISNNAGWNFFNAPGYIYGFGADTTICTGDVTLINTDNFNANPGTTYEWQDGSTESTFLVTDEDEVEVQVTYGLNCSTMDKMNIYRILSPEISLGNDTSICEGDTVPINVNTTGLSYVWMNGSTDSILFATTSGTYSVEVANAQGCTSWDDVKVDVLPAPYVDLGGDITINYNEAITLDAGNPGASFLWSTGETTPRITVSGEQTLWVDVFAGGCKSSDTIRISEYPQCIIDVPSAFSPNGDYENDILYVRGSGFAEMEFSIYNRFGEMVFKTKDNSQGWDGTYQGKKQAIDAYNYVLKGKCIGGQTVVRSGTITLLR